MGAANLAAIQYQRKTMKWNRRTASWGFALLFVFVAVYWAPPDATVVAPTQANLRATISPSGGTVAQTGGQERLLHIRDRTVPENLSSAFSGISGELETKANLPVAKPIAPISIDAPIQAPPLPFRFIGRYVEDGQTKIFLQNLDQDIAIKMGDTIQQIYRVESVSESAVTFIYLPLGQKQTLDLGGRP